jgi:PKD repeat protein
MLGLQNNGNSIYDENGENSFFTTTGDPVTGTGLLDFHIEEKQMFLSAAVDEDNAVIEPGDTVGFVMAVVIAQGTDNLNSITELRDASYEAKTLWDSNFNGVGLVDRPILESDEDYGLFNDFDLGGVAPGGTVQLTQTYQNSGNVALNISISSETDGFSMDPESASIPPGETSSFTFLYNAENYTINSYQVPSEIGTIQAAVDAAMQTNFDATIDLIDNDNYNAQSNNSNYFFTGDTIMVSPGTYTENIYFNDKSINLIATDGDPASTILDGNNNGRVITADGSGLFTLKRFTIQHGFNVDGSGLAGAGILVNGNAIVNITNNIIKNNNVGENGYGAGLYSFNCTGTVSRNIFFNNTATYGSAVRLNHGAINFYNNTLWNNDLIDWGVVYVRSSDHRVINNIIWDNYDSEFSYIRDNDNDAAIVYNIVKNGYDGTGNISDDPQIYDPDNGDFRLSASSPAIDAGDPDLDNDGEDYSTDEDDQDPDGSRMDIGTFVTNIILSTSTEHTVHGDTALVDVQISGELPLSMSSIDISFSGFQDKLIFHDIVTDGYMFGNLDWVTQVNDTEELLITASAGASSITETGILFVLELIVPDTLSTQFVPIVISDFLGNTDITDGTFLNGGVEVVWEPTANFISNTTTGYLPLVISFTDTSEIGTYPINQWAWDFGDDSTATGADVQHTYTQEGQYTVTLTVTDEFGLSDTLTMVDYIDALYPIYPVAGFSASVTSGDYPLSVTFTDTSSVGTYEINNWLWDFGNDSTGSGSSVSMSYQRPGEFDVTLTITDEYGLNDTLIASSIIQVDTTFGDVDWNTAVQSFDASLILQDLVEIIELDSLQMLIGDVSGDSSLSTLDATLILQYVVGLIDELPYTAGTQYMATGDLNMDNQGIDPGMQIEIPIHISNGSNIYGFTGTINYDHTILNYDTLLLSDYLEGYLMAFNELSPGEIKIAASGNNPDGETGVFATMVFYVTDAFTDETSISITDLTWNEGEMIELAAEMTIAYGLGVDGVTIPDVYALHQNYPNPFNPTTQIKYDLPEDAMVSITIYDIMGRSISSLVNSKQTAGYRSIQWNATNNFGESVSAGMYIYMIHAGEFRKVKKMVLLK